MEQFESKSIKPLNIVLFVTIVLFLFFCGGAIWVTLEFGGMIGTGWKSGISWMWIPALLFLTLSILIGWVIKAEKNDID